MPSLVVRRSRRLSRRPPRDAVFEEFEDYDLEQLCTEDGVFGACASIPPSPPSSPSPSPSPFPSPSPSPPSSLSPVSSVGSPYRGSKETSRAELCSSPVSSRGDGTSPGRARTGRGHAPRPPNAFFCFRSTVCKWVGRRSVEKQDNREISKKTGRLWDALSAEQKGEYGLFAERVKRVHQQEFPGYKYSPSSRNSPKTVVDKVAQDRWKNIFDPLLDAFEDGLDWLPHLIDAHEHTLDQRTGPDHTRPKKKSRARARRAGTKARVLADDNLVVLDDESIVDDAPVDSAPVDEPMPPASHPVLVPSSTSDNVHSPPEDPQALLTSEYSPSHNSLFHDHTSPLSSRNVALALLHGIPSLSSLDTWSPANATAEHAVHDIPFGFKSSSRADVSFYDPIDPDDNLTATSGTEDPVKWDDWFNFDP